MPHEDEKELIKRKTRRLQKLKEQEATMGIHTPPHILTEIEDIEVEIEKLRTKLRIIKVLAKLSEDVGVPYTLPYSLTADHFHTKEDADGVLVDFI